jgi:nicotinamidase-related amidase
LENILKNNDIRDVVVTGCATDFCVDATIHSLLARDYYITVIKDGHTTAQRPQLEAEKVIHYHNWLWENMIHTEGRIAVVACDEYLHICEGNK